MICLILVLLCAGLHIVSGDTFYIVTSSRSPCPGEYSGVPCITLQWYTSYPSRSQNITLIVESGSYNLSTILTLSDGYNFTMVSTNATVTCTSTSTRFIFNRVENVHISGITFQRCNTAIRMTNVANAVLTRNTFTNSHLTSNTDYQSGGCLYLTSSLVIISENTFKNNRVKYHGGAIYATSSTITIDRSEFINCITEFGNGGAIASYSSNIIVNNSAFNRNAAGTQYLRWFPDYYGGAIYIRGSVLSRITIDNSEFSHNIVYKGFGGAVYMDLYNSIESNIARTIFRNNIAKKNGGAIYAKCNTRLNTCITKIARSLFSQNIANINGGAVYAEGTNSTVQVTTSSFVTNTAMEAGGAIYLTGLKTNITLSLTIFNNNSASFCGVLDVNNYKHIVNLTNSVFINNTATGQDIGGGVACVLNASINIINSTFRRNHANNHAGVFLIEESVITADRSSFINNTAAVDGGVFHTSVHASDYIIRRSQFSSNRAGDDGGVMLIGRLNSSVSINESVFDFNSAVHRGGVIAIIASTLHMEINHTNIFNNSAQYGAVISACTSQITFSGESLNVTADPVLPFCMLYEGNIHDFNITLPDMPTQPVTTVTEAPTTTQQATTEPMTTQQATTEPATTEPATTEPTTTQQATTEPATTEPATTEPMTTQQATTEPATTEPATTEPMTTQQVTTEPATTQQVTTEPMTTQQVTTEPANAIFKAAADSNLIFNTLSAISLSVSFILSVIVIVQGVVLVWFYYHMKHKFNIKVQKMEEISSNEYDFASALTYSNPVLYPH